MIHDGKVSTPHSYLLGKYIPRKHSIAHPCTYALFGVKDCLFSFIIRFQRSPMYHNVGLTTSLPCSRSSWIFLWIHHHECQWDTHIMSGNFEPFQFACIYHATHLLDIKALGISRVCFHDKESVVGPWYQSMRRKIFRSFVIQPFHRCFCIAHSCGKQSDSSMHWMQQRTTSP